MNTLKKLKRIVIGTVVALKAKHYVPIEHTVNGDLLKGKVALITGGSGGIGFAIAKALVAVGKVIIAGTNEKKLAGKITELPEATACVINLSSVDKIKEGVKRAISIYGHMIFLLIQQAYIPIKSLTIFWKLEIMITTPL